MQSQSVAHLKPPSCAVARETMNTIAGLSLFPPAPKIWSAAAFNKSLRSPTIDFRFTVNWFISACTGASISDEVTVAEMPCPSASMAKLVAGTALLPICDCLDEAELLADELELTSSLAGA